MHALSAALLLMLCAGVSACGTQAPRVSPCAASVAAVETSNTCPTAAIRFRVSVAECAKSSGEFAYQFTLVNQSHKTILQKSGTWINDKTQEFYAAQVPLECDDEILDVQVLKVTACTCGGP